MKGSLAILLAQLVLLLAACGTEPLCPPRPESDRFLSSAEMQALPAPGNEVSLPAEVRINSRVTRVDQVITGPLCHANWKGIVYVSCSVRVRKWENEPLFLNGCEFSIEPGTVIYVAYHNDAAYYNGCSCHTGEKP